MPAEVAGQGAAAPAWSPDGRSLLFARLEGGSASIATVRTDGSALRVLVSPAPGRSLRAPCWASDGASFWCADGDSLLRCSAEGARLAARAIAELVPGGTLDPRSRLAVLPGADSLLVTIDLDEPVDREGWEGPAPSIHLVQPAHGQARHLTTLGEIEWDPCWVRGATYLYVTLPANERVPRLMKVSLRGGRRERVALDARSPAVAR
jgi:hypothetical protein